jgi:hypothetical protein
MPDVTVERRSAPRHTMVLAAEVVEHPRGTKFNARTAGVAFSRIEGEGLARLDRWLSEATHEH